MPKKPDTPRSILIVSASEQFDTIVKRSLKDFITIEIRKSGSQARRCTLERDFDLVVINTPLPDETGEELALDIAEHSRASVLIVTPRDIYDEVLERVTDRGILAVARPFQRGLIDKAIRYMVSVQSRIYVLQARVDSAEEKLEEFKQVSRAKSLLMEEKHMTEDEAHRFIGKLAMDNGVSRGRVAQEILAGAL